MGLMAVAVTASSAQRALSVRSVVLLLPVRAPGKFWIYSFICCWPLERRA